MGQDVFMKFLLSKKTLTNAYERFRAFTTQLASLSHACLKLGSKTEANTSEQLYLQITDCAAFRKREKPIAAPVCSNACSTVLLISIVLPISSKDPIPDGYDFKPSNTFSNLHI